MKAYWALLVFVFEWEGGGGATFLSCFFLLVLVCTVAPFTCINGGRGLVILVQPLACQALDVLVLLFQYRKVVLIPKAEMRDLNFPYPPRVVV